MRVCIVGRGKVGTSLARALHQAGVDCKLSAGSLTRLPRGRDVFLLAVPDARIREVALALAPLLPARSVVLHCAGARDLSELLALRAHGAQVGVFHPLVSFASARGSVLRDATFTAFGDPRARAAARKLARQLHARVVVLDAAPGPAYHAAAALVANGAAALAQLGVQALAALGFAPRAAEQALASLLQSVAQNVAAVGVPAALTGPVVRGDSVTVAAHLGALGKLDPKLARAYLALAPAILDSARSAGLDPRLARRLARTLASARDTLR